MGLCTGVLQIQMSVFSFFATQLTCTYTLIRTLSAVPIELYTNLYTSESSLHRTDSWVPVASVIERPHRT